MSTWHQDKAGGAWIKPHATGWTVVHNPPGDCMGVIILESKEKAEAYAKKVPHCTVIPPLPPTKMLQCCCCGMGTRGRQWWNRDTGYGLCNDCIDYCGVGEVKDGAVADSYGVRGYHWGLMGE